MKEQNESTESFYEINKIKFRLKELTLADDKKLKSLAVDITSQLGGNTPEIQINFDNEDKFAEFLSIILEPVNSNGTYEPEFYLNIKKKLRPIIIKDFFLENLKENENMMNVLENLLMLKKEQSKESPS